MLTKEYTRKIEYFIKHLPRRMYEAVGAFSYTGFFTYERLSLEEALQREKEELLPGLHWGRKWEYGWFFTEVTIPKECKGRKVVFEAKQGESVVFVNGDICGAFDREHTHVVLTECAEGGEHFEIAMEAYGGHDGLENTLMQDHAVPAFTEVDVSEFPEGVEQKIVKAGSYGIFHQEIFALWMDIQTLYDLRGQLDEDSLRKAKIDKALSDACDRVNLELPTAEFLKNAEEGRGVLAEVLNCTNGSTAPVMYAIGHSHLDLEWLWTDRETRRKIARTLGNQLKLMEKYKDYKYIQSQPWLLEVLKEEEPKLFAKVKEAVQEGRIIVEGGTWVEPDTNIPSGESLIRQFMLGKGFIKEEFGKESEIFWLPDSFGMSPSLPQIMKGCDIKYFMNAKITWQYNGGDEVPYSNFWWQGLDGSKILTAIIQGYASEMRPSEIFAKWHQNTEKSEVPIRLHVFGHGDGGGGATPIHLEYMEREKDLEGMPRVISAGPNAFFEALEECEVSGKYVGELYYSAHRGTYTAQARTKKGNRTGEFALREAQLWAALLEDTKYAQIDALWKKLLFHQFHDILPGTAITAVYEKTEREQREVVEGAQAIYGGAMDKILQKDAEYVTLFNSLSWDRLVRVELPKGYSLFESAETQQFEDKTIVLAEVPACGYRTYRLEKNKAVVCETGVSLKAENENICMENELLRTLWNQNGELLSVFDKETQMEYLEKPSNIFRMYQDMPTFFDAWDIDSFYEKTELPLEGKAEVELLYQGAAEACLLIRKQLHDSYLEQQVYLRKGSKRLDFVTNVNWKETHKLLKVDFNTNIRTEELISEMQFGYVKRPNHKTRRYDADRFEVCQHKWSALCEGRRGAAILNDCKYGISADDQRMSLTLLTSSTRPARSADKGVQQFTYSFLPFSEALADSSVVREAYELNCPIVMREGNAGTRSFMQVSEANIIIDTVKEAEDGSGDKIVRMYESANCHTVCQLKLDFPVSEVYQTNMLEKNQEKLEITEQALKLVFKPFEVITIRLKK